MRRTLEVAERCNVEIALDRILLPTFPTPGGRDAFEYLVELCEAGLAKRYEQVTPELTERLQFELKTIREMGFADYFLIVADFIGFAKRNGVSVGPGRGSAAGSLAAYALAITDIDPMRYGLLFERFLNPARKDMPDMDIDFAVEGRERVINYVAEKYGRDRVAQIITFSTMAARAAVRDAGRVLEIPYGTVDRIAKLIPEGPGADARGGAQAGRRARERGRRRSGRAGDRRSRAAARRADAGRLDPRRRRRHRRAAADRGRAAAAEGRRPGGRDAGLDEERRGARPAEDGLPRPPQPRRDRQGGRADRRAGSTSRRSRSTTAKTYEMLARADSMGVFQFESSGMREALRQVKPTEFEDLIALVALYRPGPMAVHPELRGPEERPRAGHVHRRAAAGDHRRRPTGSASTRSSTCRSPSRWPASRRPRPRRCARRSARRSTR